MHRAVGGQDHTDGRATEKLRSPLCGDIGVVMGVTTSTRIRQMIAPLGIDAAAVLAGGYSINKLTDDGPSQWWWMMAVGSAVVLVASGIWKLWIERRRSMASSAARFGPTASEVSDGGSNTAVDAGEDTGIGNGGVSITAENNSVAAWNVNGTVNLGGSSRTSGVEPSHRANEDRES